MKKIITAIVLLTILLMATSAMSATKTFEREYTYQASEIDSKVTSRAIALEQVKRALLEELGTFLVSETTIKNMKLTLDQVTTLSAGVVSTEITSEKWDGETYWLRARIEADLEEVARSINDLKGDRQKIKELEEARREAEEAKKELEQLRAEFERLKAEKGTLDETANISKNYQKAVNKLSATDLFEKAYAHQKSGRYKEAIDAYSKAISLNPEYAEIYYNRGMAYVDLMQYDKAIKDLNKATALDPELAIAYIERGIAYSILKQYDRAFKDYNKAILLDPELAEAYNTRGFAYSFLKQYDKAMRYYNELVAGLDRARSDQLYWKAQLGRCRCAFQAYAGQSEQMKRLVIAIRQLRIMDRRMGGLAEKFDAIERQASAASGKSLDG